MVFVSSHKGVGLEYVPEAHGPPWSAGEAGSELLLSQPQGTDRGHLGTSRCPGARGAGAHRVDAA